MAYNRLVVGLSCLLALALAVGCDRGQPAGSSSAAAAPVEVRLGYFPNVTHAQAVLGVASGEFSAALAPNRLSTKIFNAGPSLVEALFGGEIDIGYIGPGPALTAHARSAGQGVRIIAGAAANGVLIVARPGSGIASLKDLPGHRIATPQVGNTQDISAKHYLRFDLKQPNVDNVVAVNNSEQAAAMARGDVDAAWAPEPWGSRLVQESGAIIIAKEEDLWPQKQFTLTVVITTPTFLAQHPDIVRKFLQVHRSWTARLQQDPATYAVQLDDALLTLNGKRLPKGVLESAVKYVQFTDEPLEQTLGAFSQWSYDLQFTRSPIDLKGLVDTSILRSLQAMPAAPAATAQRAQPAPAASAPAR